MKNYSIGLYEKAIPASLTWEEKLTVAKEAGYDFLEMSIDESPDKLSRLEWSKEKRLELVKTMYATDLPIRSMCLSGHRKYPFGSADHLIRERAMQIMELALDLADDLGIRAIQLAGYDVYYEDGNEETRRFFAENIKKAVEMAAKKGIVMGFETMETAFMDTVKKAMKYVDENQSPYLNVYPDCGNITNAAEIYAADVLDDIDAGKDKMIAMHLKETKPGIYRNMFYGEGYVKFDKIIAKAWECGIRRYVTEFWYLGSKNWRQDIHKACEKMSSLLDKQV